MIDSDSAPFAAPPALAGAGIGLRSQHYAHVLETLPKVPWFEALTDNYLNAGGRPLAVLEQVRAHYPITFHGVGLSLGGVDPLDESYLDRLQQLITRFQPTLVSDHLCWTHHGGQHSNDLLPIPYTDTAVQHVADRIARVQDRLGRELVVENVSSYMRYQASEMSEAEFLSAVIQRAGCGLLCDVNNIYVSARNHGYDAAAYLQALPAQAVREIHLAGYDDQGTFLLDTHGAAVQPPVWELYQAALARFGAVPTLIEWDTDIPAFEVLMAERDRAARMLDQVDDDAA